MRQAQNVAIDAGLATDVALSAVTFLSLLVLLVFISGKVNSRTAAVKRRIAMSCVACVAALIAFTDYPLGTLDSFWRDHALLSGALVTVLLVGAGLLAVDARAEEARAERFDRAVLTGARPLLVAAETVYHSHAELLRELLQACELLEIPSSVDGLRGHIDPRIDLSDPRLVLGQVLAGGGVNWLLFGAEPQPYDDARPPDHSSEPRRASAKEELWRYSAEVQEWTRTCLIVDHGRAWDLQRRLVNLEERLNLLDKNTLEVILNARMVAGYRFWGPVEPAHVGDIDLLLGYLLQTSAELLEEARSELLALRLDLRAAGVDMTQWSHPPVTRGYPGDVVHEIHAGVREIFTHKGGPIRNWPSKADRPGRRSVTERVSERD